jgi:hypothetical protein
VLRQDPATRILVLLAAGKLSLLRAEAYPNSTHTLIPSIPLTPYKSLVVIARSAGRRHLLACHPTLLSAFRGAAGTRVSSHWSQVGRCSISILCIGCICCPENPPDIANCCWYCILASRCPCIPHTLHSPLKIPLGLVPPSCGCCRFPVGSVFIVAACSFCISFNTFCCSSDGMLYVMAGAAPHLKLLANLRSVMRVVGSK